MPRKSEWIQRLEFILPHLRSVPEDILDRSAIEVLFRVKPRQATRLLRKMGARTIGGALVISRAELLTALETVAQGSDIQYEQRRRQRLAVWLEQAKREAGARQICIPDVIDIPEGIHLEPGRLEIRFSDAVELLQKMMHLAQIAAEDWHLFQERTR